MSQLARTASLIFIPHYTCIYGVFLPVLFPSLYRYCGGILWGALLCQRVKGLGWAGKKEPPPKGLSTMAVSITHNGNCRIVTISILLHLKDLS